MGAISFKHVLLEKIKICVGIAAGLAFDIFVQISALILQFNVQNDDDIGAFIIVKVSSDSSALEKFLE